ncbi:hypothetical protein [Lysinibacillus fusiformis]|uniref:hypothetical protein n=1 Tax=Lysinibacillus fusiformis TaxID=28031 RepID=UPI003662DC5C
MIILLSLSVFNYVVGGDGFYFMKKPIPSLTIAGLLKQSENKKSASFAGDERSLLAWS